MPPHSNHAELLIYDWSEMGDVEVVVEDIERLNLDDYDRYDPKMEDWRITKEMEWGHRRMMWVPAYASDVLKFIVEILSC